MDFKKYMILEEIPDKLSQLEIDVEVEQNTNYFTIITLPANGWNSENGQYITVKGIEADETKQAIYLYPVNNEANMEAIADYDITAMSQDTDKIYFTCSSIPEVDVQFQVEWEYIDYIMPGQMILGKFQIDSQYYNFYFGMTLIDWCASEFNTQGYWINEYGMWNADLSMVNHDLHSGTNIMLNSDMSFTLYPSRFVPIATVFTFYIENQKYHAEENMTWRSWCLSKYNTTNYYEIENGTDDYIYEVAEDIYSVEQVRNCSTGNTIIHGTEVAPDDPIEAITYELNRSVTLPVIKNFTINGTSYEYMVGMNLSLWCDSKFNTDEFYLNENGIWTQDGFMYNKTYTTNNNITISESLNIQLENYLDDANTGIFYINNTTFEYPININWKTWANTNPDFIIEDEYIKYNNKYLAYKVISNIIEIVFNEDTIQNGYNYTLSETLPFIPEPPADINFTLTLPNAENQTLTIEENTTWNTFVNSEEGQDMGLTIDENDYIIINSPILYSTTILSYIYYLADMENNKIQKNDIILPQGYQFIYEEPEPQPIAITKDNFAQYFYSDTLNNKEGIGEDVFYWKENNIIANTDSSMGTNEMYWKPLQNISSLQFTTTLLSSESLNITISYSDLEETIIEGWGTKEILNIVANNNITFSSYHSRPFTAISQDGITISNIIITL